MNNTGRHGKPMNPSKLVYGNVTSLEDGFDYQRMLMGKPIMHRATLPYPPSVNRYWRNFRGRMVLSKEGRAYKKRVAELLDGLRPIGGGVSITIHAYRPRKIGDLDNILKGALDALSGYMYFDDKQIVMILAHRYDDKEYPRLEVTVNAT